MHMHMLPKWKTTRKSRVAPKITKWESINFNSRSHHSWRVSILLNLIYVAAKQDQMRKREEFAVSLRKENKRVKLNEKRAKLTTKMRPGMSSTSDLLTSHECISDPSMSPVLITPPIMIDFRKISYQQFWVRFKQRQTQTNCWLWSCLSDVCWVTWTSIWRITRSIWTSYARIPQW